MVAVIDNLNSTQLSKFDEDSIEIQKLSDFLKSQAEVAFKNEAEKISSIELKDWVKDESDDNNKSRFYNVKTMKVGWIKEKSLIHVFVNTTAVKHFEMEKARNQCLQLMFSSVSHEFRTPINAFSNSMLIIESNYRNFI